MSGSEAFEAGSSSTIIGNINVRSRCMAVSGIRTGVEMPLAAGGQSAIILPMEKPKITAWLKTYCGWSNGVRAVLKKYNLEFEEKDIIKNPAFRWEMEQKSGQPLSPCVEVNGQMLPDISGEEVE